MAPARCDAGALGVDLRRFAPQDRLERVAWLFKGGVVLPRPSAEGWQAGERDLAAAQVAAAGRLFEEGGIADVLALARLTETASWLGKAVYDAGIPATDVDTPIEASVTGDHQREHDVAHGMIYSVLRERGEAWGRALIARARSERWSENEFACGPARFSGQPLDLGSGGGDRR